MNPCLASIKDISKPIPLELPVTTATLFSLMDVCKNFKLISYSKAN
jgi:hypothetical protein